MSVLFSTDRRGRRSPFTLHPSEVRTRGGPGRAGEVMRRTGDEGKDARRYETGRVRRTGGGWAGDKARGRWAEQPTPLKRSPGRITTQGVEPRSGEAISHDERSPYLLISLPPHLLISSSRWLLERHLPGDRQWAALSHHQCGGSPSVSMTERGERRPLTRAATASSRPSRVRGNMGNWVRMARTVVWFQ